MTIYRASICIGRFDVMHHDFSELTAATRCYERLVEAQPLNQISLWQGDSVRAGKLVNARLIDRVN